MNNEIPPKTSADKDLEIEALKQKMAASREQDKELLQAFIDMNPDASKERIDSLRKAMNLEDEGEDISKPIILNEETKEEDQIWSPEKMRVYETRQVYTQEYLKCRKEMGRKVRIERTRVAAQNLLTGVKNVFMKEGHKIDKKHFDEEQYFTGEYIESKKAYDQARVEMGNALYHEKYAELKAQGLSGQKLQDALTEYRSTEILEKTIIEERQKLIDAKAEGSPNPALWKIAIDKYRKLPRIAKIGISTAIFGIAAAASAGAVTSAVAGAAGWRFVRGMMSGTLVAHSVKGIDQVNKEKNEKFKKDQAVIYQEIKQKFGAGLITQEQYEKEVATLEGADRKRTRNQLLVKAAVGIAIGAGVSGFMAHEFGGVSHPNVGNNTEHLTKSPGAGTIIEKNNPIVPKPEVSHDTLTTKTPATNAFEINKDTPAVKIDTAINQEPAVTTVDNQVPAVTEQTDVTHSAVEVSVGKGHGAIQTIHELQDKLKAEYPDPTKAPASVQHILNTKADRLAMEYGMFKPGEVEESAMFKVGGKFDVDENGNVSYHESATSNETLLAKGADVKATGAYEGKMIDTDRTIKANVDTEPAQKIPTREYQQEKPELKQIDESGLKKISGDVVEKPEAKDIDMRGLKKISGDTIEKPDVKDIDMRGLKKISGNDIGESIPKGPEDLIDQGTDKNIPDSLPKSELPEIKAQSTPEILPRATPNIVEQTNNGFTNKVTMTNAPSARVPSETFGNNDGNVEPTRGIFNDGTRRNIAEDLTPLDHKGVGNMARLENDLRNVDSERDVRELFGRSNVVVDRPESPIVENNVGYREWNAATNNMLASKEVTLNNYADFEKERELQQLFGHAEHGVQYDKELDKNLEGTRMYYYKELPEWKTVDKIPARYFFDMENAKPSIPDSDWNKLVEAGVIRQNVDAMGNTHYSFAHANELKRLATVYNKVDPLNATPLGNESIEKYITRITRDLHQTKDGTLYMFKNTRTGAYLEKSLDDGSVVRREVVPNRSFQNGTRPIMPTAGAAGYQTSSEYNPNGPFAQRIGGMLGGNIFNNNSYTTPIRMTNY